MSCEQECSCCIKIEDSICIIFCGANEIERLKDSLDAVLKVKDIKIFGYPPKTNT